jgi:lipopolysaccharide transport system permease protein
MKRVIDSKGCRDIGKLTEVEKSLDRERGIFIIRNKLRNSAGRRKLGVLWLVLEPVAMSLVYLFVLTVVRSYPGIESLFIGISMFRILQASFMSGVNSIQDFTGGLISERVRSRVLVSAALRYRVLETTFQSSAISVILLFGLGVNLRAVLAFIILSQIMGILAEGVGLNMSKLVRRIPDLSNLIRYFMLLMFFGSPALYPMATTTGLHYKINEYNPFSYFVESVRYLADLESVIFNLSGTLILLMTSLLLLLTVRGYTSIDRLRWEVSSWS